MAAESHRARGRVQPRAAAIRARLVTDALRLLLVGRQRLLAAAAVLGKHRVVVGRALLAREREAGAHAGRAPAMLAVVREHPRVQLRVARAAHRACALDRQHLDRADAGGAKAVVHRMAQPVERREQMHHALAELERLVQALPQLGLVVRRHDEVGHRQLDRVLAEAVELRPRVHRHEFAVDAQVRVAARLRPLREIRVHALAIDDERREQPDVLAAMIAQQLRGDRFDGLRRHRRAVVDAMLKAELHVQQPQEMPHFGGRRDRALAAAARQPLLDRHRRRNAIHRVDFGAPGRLHDRARVRVQRFEVAALALVEEDVERERRLAGAGHAGHHVELAVRNVDVERLQVVLARIDDPHHVLAFDRAARARRVQRGLQRHARVAGCVGVGPDVHRALVLQQRRARMRAGAGLHVVGRARAQHEAAAVAAFRAEIDQPVGRADHVEIVLDHDQRMAAREQLAERLHQLRDVVEMQPGGGLVEHEEPRPRDARLFRDDAAPVARLRGFREKARQLQALRLAAGQRRHRLAELHVFEADVDDRLQHAQHVGVGGETRRGLADGQIEHVGDAERAPAALDPHFEDLGPVAAAVAVRATQVDVAQELHLDVLEAGAAAARAAAVAGVEAEGARAVAALQRKRRLREQLADLVERADIARRVRARGLADRRLVDEHDVAHLLRAREAAVRARRFGGLAEVPRHRRIEHVLQQRRFAGTRHARHAYEALQRNLDRDVAQIVLARALEHDARRARVHRPARPVRRVRDVLAAAEILARQRAGRADRAGRAVVDDRAAALARAGAHVDQPVGREHHRRIVLDDDERIARVAQAPHRLDDPVQVARMQPDARLVEHEQRLGERRAERRRQVDPLHLAARQRAALPVERQVAEPHVAQVLQPRAHLGEQQLQRIVEQRARQADVVEEAADPLDRQQHQVVHRQARQRLELRAGPVDAARHEAIGAREHRVGVRLRAEPPQQRLRLQTRAAAHRTRRVAAVFRQQHADVHLVRFRFEIAEEALHAVPLALPFAVPVRRAVDHPVLLGGRELRPRRIAPDVRFRRIAHQVVLALLPRGRLHRLDGAAAQRLARVGNHEAEIDADHAAEAAARLARAVRRVEGEQRRLRIRVAQIAVRVMKPGGVTPHLRLCRAAVRAFRRLREHIDAHPPAAALERRLDRLDRAGLVDLMQPEAVGHHVEHLARPGGRRDVAPRLHARIAARRQPLLDFLVGRVFRQFDGERDRDARVVRLRAREEIRIDRLRRVVPHQPRGPAIEQLGRARVQELQMIVELGHRADGRARAAHGVRLVDRDRGRHAVDALHLRAVHPVEKLPRIRAEGLDVAPLALRVQGVEHEARLAGARRAGDDRHFAGAQVEIDMLEIVLTCSANADQIAG
ncbi:Uncharacterised protein [Burkholderia mallei]|nr:Uncharacterised protein [Burkholderia mallei]